MNGKNPHIGSSFDDFLREEGIAEAVEEMAVTKAISLELTRHMSAAKISKRQMAVKLGTSRSQLDRMLDPNNDSVSLSTLKRAAQVIGKKLKLSFA